MRCGVISTLGSLLLFVSAVAGADSIYADFAARARGYDPIEGTLFRMEMDLNKDGRPEILLATDESSGPDGETWFFYSPQAEGGYRFLGKLHFHSEGFYFDRESLVLGIYVRANSREGEFQRWRMQASGFERVTEPPRTEAEHWTLVASYRSSRPEMLYASILKVAEEVYEGKTPAVWRVTKSNELREGLISLGASVVP